MSCLVAGIRATVLDMELPTLKDKIAAEVMARRMLRDGDLPEPDAVEYGHACIRLFWSGPKVCLVVDLEHGCADELEDISNPYPPPRD